MKFEYKIINGRDGSVNESKLNALGGDGWELATVTPHNIFYFKKQAMKAAKKGKKKTPKTVEKKADKEMKDLLDELDKM